ncbi:unnamed protein product, partial [Heterotrigona itama]
MKENMTVRGKRSEEKKSSTRNETEQKAVRRCYLCGDWKHLAADSPMKSKGTKCFKFQEYGHVAPNCSKSSKSSEDTCSASYLSQRNRCKEVEIAHSKLIALNDTGSDLSLMRADQYIQIGAPKLNNRILKFRGFGSE